MTDALHLPMPDFESPLAPFWRAAQDGELLLPGCTVCGRLDWYPQGLCRTCSSTDIRWKTLSGDARLFSWTTVTRALDARLAAIVPYVSAIVVLAEDPASRLVTRLVDVQPDTLCAELAVRARFVDLGYPTLAIGLIAPLFAPAACVD